MTTQQLPTNAVKATPLQSDNFDTTLSNANVPVLVDFWAEWCPPCRDLGPIIDEVAQEQVGKAIVTKVDVSAEEDLARRFQVTSIPTLMIFKDGDPVERFQGFQQKETIERALRTHA